MLAKESGFEKRRRRTRFGIKSNSDRVRLSVSRSGKHIYAQIIDDTKGITIASASTVDKELKKAVKKPGNVEAAKAVGALIAKRAVAAKVKEVVFDRGGVIYHGRIKALADAAREGGLLF